VRKLFFCFFNDNNNKNDNDENDVRFKANMELCSTKFSILDFYCVVWMTHQAERAKSMIAIWNSKRNWNETIRFGKSSALLPFKQNVCHYHSEKVKTMKHWNLPTRHFYLEIQVFIFYSNGFGQSFMIFSRKFLRFPEKYKFNVRIFYK
jgi:hypothetical protein